MTVNSDVTRRGFLRGGLALGAGGLALPALLDACGSAISTQGTANNVKLPTYMAPKIPAAQFPGDTAGVQNIYYQLPSTLTQSVKGTPGNGGTVTALTLTYNTPPSPMSQNAFWQELNKRLGVTYQPTLVAAADFAEKMATTMASSSLPDFMLIFGGVSQYGAVPNEVEFFQSKCTDLTPYLSGDAAKQYPNLAALSDFAWKSSVYDSKIYAIPIPEGVWWEGMFILQDLADQAGISQPKNSTEFKQVMTEINAPKQGRWAIGGQTGFSYNLNFFFQMFGVPNFWAVDKNGKFTANLETPQAQEAVAYMRTLHEAGLFHPQAESMTTVQCKDAFYAAQICSYQDGFGAYTGLQTNTTTTSGHTVGVIVPPGHSGGRGQYYFGSGVFAVTAIPKTSKSRVEELLRIADYFAAPFGSEEYLFLNYGISGVDYNPDAHGNPILTKQGQSEVNPNGVETNFITTALPATYTPGQQTYAKNIYASEKVLAPIGTTNPTIGFYSPTNATQGSTLNTNLNDGAASVIAGREPISYWKTVVEQWRSQGGSQIRKEYEQAYQKAHKGGRA